jgi:hypothetical protein
VLQFCSISLLDTYSKAVLLALVKKVYGKCLG